MSSRGILFGVLVACAGAASSRGEQARRFELDVPAGADTRATYLVLRDVEVPRNSSIVLRAYALGQDNTKALLGSAAVPGVAPDATGTTKLPEVRINVTTGIRRWLATAGSRRKAVVEIIPGGSGPADSTAAVWSVRTAQLVQPQ